MNKFYPLKQWIAALIIGPLLPSVLGFFMPIQGVMIADNAMYPIYLGFGFVFSFLILMVLYLVFLFVIKTIHSHLAVKIILNLVAILCVFTLFKLIGGAIARDLSISYSCAVIISSCLFTLKVSNPQNDSSSELSQGELFS